MTDTSTAPSAQSTHMFNNTYMKFLCQIIDSTDTNEMHQYSQGSRGQWTQCEIELRSILVFLMQHIIVHMVQFLPTRCCADSHSQVHMVLLLRTTLKQANCCCWYSKVLQLSSIGFSHLLDGPFAFTCSPQTQSYLFKYSHPLKLDWCSLLHAAWVVHMIAHLKWLVGLSTQNSRITLYV